MSTDFKKILLKPYFWLRTRYIRIKGGSFALGPLYSGHFKVKYRNVPMLKCPFDYVMYQMIISEIKPDLVIEIGTNEGGTTLYLADIMNSLDKGVIHSIDIEDRAAKQIKNNPRIKLFLEGWEKYNLENTAGFKTILVIDDASHYYQDTLSAMKKFSEVVSKDSYYIVEDGIVTRLGRDKALQGGPLRAIHEFLKLDSRYIIDRNWCDMFGKNATFNTNGYLKRIK